MDVDARLKALEAENERLRDELDRLKSSRGITGRPIWPVEWRLTGKESQLLGALASGRPQSKEALMDALYAAGPDDEPAIKIIDVFVCKIRKKLAPFGITITTLWGRGYQLAPESMHALQPSGQDAAA